MDQKLFGESAMCEKWQGWQIFKIIKGGPGLKSGGGLITSTAPIFALGSVRSALSWGRGYRVVWTCQGRLKPPQPPPRSAHAGNHKDIPMLTYLFVYSMFTYIYTMQLQKYNKIQNVKHLINAHPKRCPTNICLTLKYFYPIPSYF